MTKLVVDKCKSKAVNFMGTDVILATFTDSAGTQVELVFELSQFSHFIDGMLDNIVALIKQDRDRLPV